MAGKARVHELAKELGKTSKEIMAKLNEMGEFVKSPSSTIEAPVVRKLRDAFPATKPAGPKADLPTNGSAAPRSAPSGGPGRPGSVAPRPAATVAGARSSTGCGRVRARSGHPGVVDSGGDQSGSVRGIRRAARVGSCRSGRRAGPPGRHGSGHLAPAGGPSVAPPRAAPAAAARRRRRRPLPSRGRPDPASRRRRAHRRHPPPRHPHPRNGRRQRPPAMARRPRLVPKASPRLRVRPVRPVACPVRPGRRGWVTTRSGSTAT